jgi:hypothetical protein
VRSEEENHPSCHFSHYGPINPGLQFEMTGQEVVLAHAIHLAIFNLRQLLAVIFKTN